jgi:hypothetical protein
VVCEMAPAVHVPIGEVGLAPGSTISGRVPIPPFDGSMIHRLGQVSSAEISIMQSVDNSVI